MVNQPRLGQEKGTEKTISIQSGINLENEVINRIYATGYVENNRGEKLFALGSAIPYDEGMTIYNLIRQTKPLATLEIGMAFGLSSLFACQAHADNNMGGLHIAIDPKQSEVFQSVGLINIEKAGLNNHFKFFEACSYEILPQLLKQRKQFDFIFIDGMHVFDFTLIDFFFSDLLLKVGGYIMFDDLWMPSVRKVASYVLKNRHYRLTSRWVWQPRSLIGRFIDFFRKGRARKTKVKTILLHQLRKPTDLSFIYFALKGNLKYQIFQKLAEDDRSWDHHREF